jgi:SPOR domain
MARPIRGMFHTMRLGILIVLLIVVAGPGAHAQATTEEGPLSPCEPSQAESSAPAGQPAWGIEIASAFSKDQALSEFDKVKQDHSDLLGSYAPIVVESCDLHMGTALRYSARIGVDSRDAADALCAKLQQAGGACIVQKN